MATAVRNVLATGKIVRLLVHATSCKGLPLESTGVVALDIGYNLVTPMPDLVVETDKGISATMQFGRVYSKVEIPWNALLACGPLDTAVAPAPAPTPPKRALPKGWRVIQGGKAE